MTEEVAGPLILISVVIIGAIGIGFFVNRNMQGWNDTKDWEIDDDDDDESDNDNSSFKKPSANELEDSETVVVSVAPAVPIVPATPTTSEELSSSLLGNQYHNEDSLGFQIVNSISSVER